MSKKSREKIKLVSTSGSLHFYTTTKSKRKKIDKIKLKKFDPIVRKRVIYCEDNIN